LLSKGASFAVELKTLELPGPISGSVLMPGLPSSLGREMGVAGRGLVDGEGGDRESDEARAGETLAAGRGEAGRGGREEKPAKDEREDW
jgi:hypothetical protein